MKTDGFPQYVTTDYLANGLASIKDGAERKLMRAKFQGDRFAEAHAQGMLDAAQGMAKGIENYFTSGIGVQESPYVQAVAVSAVVEGICLGMVGFALWAREQRPCAHCGQVATCWGRYEGGAWAAACDECCGHGQEDGRCVSLKLEREAA